MKHHSIVSRLELKVITQIWGGGIRKCTMLSAYCVMSQVIFVKGLYNWQLVWTVGCEIARTQSTLDLRDSTTPESDTTQAVHNREAINTSYSQIFQGKQSFYQ